MALASVLASHLAPVSPVSSSPEPADDASSIVSSPGTCSSSLLADLLSSSLNSQPSLPDPPPLSTTRFNEHLAVLLPKRLWKPDAQASQCDVFVCRKRFSMWERRHHCRKCGGIFCSNCSTRTTALLDTSKLEFLNPPRDISIRVFDSPESPVKVSRVCDDCWDQIHGSRTPRGTPLIKRSFPIAVLSDSESSSSSSVASSVSAPSDDNHPIIRPSFRRTCTSPRAPSSPLRPTVVLSSTVVGVLVSDSELSLGELDSYPLARDSNTCKATGGGRWTPKPCVDFVGYRIPGAKAVYEVELEREEEEKRRRRANPIIRDGDFQLRVPREIEPRSPAGPIQLSTF